MSVVEVRAGRDVWFEGSRWVVVALGGESVTLRRGSVVRSVAVHEFAARALSFDRDGEEAAEVPVVLGSLSPEQVRDLEVRAGHVRELVGSEGGVGWAARCEAKAQQLGVSTRTVQRWVAGYRRAGVAGLADSRVRRQRASRVDQRWDAACLAVLDRFTQASTPTRGAVIDAVARDVGQAHGVGVVPLPSRAAAYQRLAVLSKGRHAFGSAKGRRSVAERPGGVLGRLRATRPGEYVVLDTTPLDVFAMEPVTLRWVPVELTVAMDLFTRCILGLRLTPVSTKAGDVANVLYQCLLPQDPASEATACGGGEPSGPDQWWPFHGVPRNVLVGTEQPDGVSQARVGGLPACLPEAIVVDHGRAYLSSHVLGACARLGITVQPAIPHKPTDKPTVERFFRTVRESLLQHLPAYKGPDVFSRGKDVEAQAFFYVSELEQVIREWVGSVYHRSPHAGLCVPEVPGAVLSPAEMFEVGLAKTGGLLLPSRPGLAYEFLDVAWRTVQHYGVEVHGQRYDGQGLNPFRGRRSPYGGVHAGKWPIFLDVHDVRAVFFQDPETMVWHRLRWEHAAGLQQPFSQDAADHVKQLALRRDRHVDPAQAVQELLGDWSKDLVLGRRDRALARRLSAQRASQDRGADDHGGRPGPGAVAPGSDRAGSDRAGSDRAGRDAAREVASLPGVIDLLTRREQKSAALEAVDDLDDVFAAYYAQHGDQDGLAVYDE